MRDFKIRLNTEELKSNFTKTNTAIYHNLLAVHEMSQISDAVKLDKRLATVLGESTNEKILAAIEFQLNHNSSLRPTEMFEDIQRRFANASESKARIVDAVGNILSKANDLASNVTEANAIGAASDIYAMGTELMSIFPQEPALAAKTAKLLSDTFKRRLSASVTEHLEMTWNGLKSVIGDGIAYHTQFKAISLESHLNSPATNSILLSHNHALREGADRAFKALLDRSNDGPEAFALLTRNACRTLIIEQQKRDSSSEFPRTASWLSAAARKADKQQLTNSFVNDLLSMPLEQVTDTLRKPLDTIRHAALEMSVPTKHAMLVQQRVHRDNGATNPTVLFRHDSFAAAITEITTPSDERRRGRTPQDPVTVPINYVIEELDLCTDMLEREGLRRPETEKACKSNMEIAQQIKQALLDAPEAASDISISWGRDPNQVYFSNLKKEVDDGIELSKEVAEIALQHRKAELRANAVRLLTGGRSGPTIDLTPSTPDGP